MGAPTLDDVKAYLNITVTDKDDELTLFLGAARRVIERRVGPLEAEAFTQTYRSRGGDILVSHRPVQSLTSVTVLTDTLAFDIEDLSFDSRAGVVYRLDGGPIAGTFTLGYTAGLDAVSDNVHLAVLRQVRHMWNTMRGNTRRPTDDDSFQSQSGAWYAIPYSVLELLGDDDLVQGIA